MWISFVLDEMARREQSPFHAAARMGVLKENVCCAILRELFATAACCSVSEAWEGIQVHSQINCSAWRLTLLVISALSCLQESGCNCRLMGAFHSICVSSMLVWDAVLVGWL